MLPIDRTDEKKITTNGQSMQVNKKKTNQNEGKRKKQQKNMYYANSNKVKLLLKLKCSAWHQGRYQVR